MRAAALIFPRNFHRLGESVAVTDKFLTSGERRMRDMEVEIASNEEKRQSMSDVRVSGWAVLLAVVATAGACWLYFFM